MNATSRYLNLTPRTEQQALLDMERQVKPHRNTGRKIGALQRCLTAISALDQMLTAAEREMEIGNDMGDERAWLNDIRDNVQWRIKELSA